MSLVEASNWLDGGLSRHQAQRPADYLLGGLDGRKKINVPLKKSEDDLKRRVRPPTQRLREEPPRRPTQPRRRGKKV